MIELTENLLYKLEEKMMQILSDKEALGQQVQRLQHENAILRQEKEELRQEKQDNTQRLRNLVALLDSVNPSEAAPVSNAFMAVESAAVVQG